MGPSVPVYLELHELNVKYLTSNPRLLFPQTHPAHHRQGYHYRHNIPIEIHCRYKSTRPLQSQNMSRHRMVRNLTEDDYDDDYYDEDDYYEDDDEYVAPKKAPPKANQAPTVKYAPQKNNTKSTKVAAVSNTPKGVMISSGTLSATPGGVPKPATSGTVTTTATATGVTKPPPGWGKPVNAEPIAPVGVSKPPPGWGKPKNETTATSAGITSPPPGWGKPLGVPPTTTSGSPNPPSAPMNAPATNSAKLASNNQQQSSSQKSQNTKPFEKALPAFLQERQNNLPSQLSMVVLGHVDAGKSTLMGQLLIQTGQINKRQALRGGANLAWLLDENESERARGVTMEIGTKALTTKNHRIVVLDAPGHADFIPIMITGAANADTCILVVDAVTGEFESGFSGGGQTKEHILLAKGLGVSQVIVAVNKLDVEGWKEDRYQVVSQEVVDYLTRQKFKLARIQCVPVSGLTGENVESQTEPLLRQWYSGPTLLQAMNRFKPANRQLEKPLRFLISDMYAEGKGVVTRGRVAQGFVQVGDKVQVLPLGDPAMVSRVEHLVPPDDGGDRLTVAIAGDTVELNLSNVDPSRVTVGNVVVDTTYLPRISSKATAKVLIMDQLTVPIIRGAQVLFHMHSLDIPAVITKLISTLKPDGSINKERPRALTSGVSAVVELKLDNKIVMEAFQDCRALGRFVLRRGGDTIAVGVIEEIIL